MDTIKEWAYCHHVSRLLLSSRPFSFFYDDSKGPEPRHGAMVDMPGVDSAFGCNHSDQRNDGPFHLQSRSAEIPGPSSSNATNSGIRALSEVESLQVNFLRLVQRIGLSPNNILVSQVLYRLQLAELIRGSDSVEQKNKMNIDSARAIASRAESSGVDKLDFSFKILVLGRTGVGKSATINSIFNQKMAATNAFGPATRCIQEVVGHIKGIKVSIIDTPGLSPSYINQRRNRKILLAVKRYIRRSPPDIVLYFERLDVINRGYSDFPLLKLVTDVFGPAIWHSTILVMTHSSSAMPEGHDGYPVSYETFVARSKKLVQHFIHESVSDNKLDNPLLLVENDPLCKTNMEGEKILPDGTVWRHHFLFLCISSKILADANKIFKFQDSIRIGHVATRLPSLPHLLSVLLRHRSTKNPSGSDNEMDELIELDDDDEDYDDLPPIRILTKPQFQKLTSSQKNQYLDELDYRETLYLKKQWKEEVKRRKESQFAKADVSESNYDDDDNTCPDAVPLPDMNLPWSFDSDYPVHRYRGLLRSNQWVPRPVLDSQGWDHDIGFDGVNLESSISVRDNLHASITGQMKKDKDELNLQGECAAAYNLGGHSIRAGIDFQTAGRDLMCTVRGDAALENVKYNNVAACGLSLTSFRDSYVCGGKIEDVISFGSKFRLGMNMGCIGGCGQVAYGGGLEATIKGKDYPVRDDKVALGMTLLSFDKEAVFGGSINSDFRAGRGNKVSIQASLNSRKMGQISLKTSTSEHVEIALLALLTIGRVMFRRSASDDLPEDCQNKSSS